MHIRCYEAVVAQWHSVGHNCDDCGFDLIDSGLCVGWGWLHQVSSVYKAKNIFLCHFLAKKGRQKSMRVGGSQYPIYQLHCIIDY